MTDTNTNEKAENPNAQQAPRMPETDSYTIAVTRIFEVDLSPQQVKGMMGQTNSDDPQEAVERVFTQREVQAVEPEQKLIGANAQVQSGPEGGEGGEDAQAPDDEAE